MGRRLSGVGGRAGEDLCRAFGDPEKGATGAALSVMQNVKLKEISAKAKGQAPKAGQGFRSRASKSS
jgi:hypothetical protein